ncbi:hypothetical protein CHLRE_13g605404v5 [Chlamydomonas reinhardtii]|uniref:Uncharacterized protein n=1 Tax=Chlamydomonas reinhardtii TaxID=3055 RepID=A0A2K3D1F6_CHLRE|nr:uncharacterized protein CHLRE_13g605404v5 [Chlamydomonas reinhardtii]PNW74365.1 hypothetical protein CHLRE_13g605404v5 [Chlamydomonas reinhardtii]
MAANQHIDLSAVSTSGSGDDDSDIGTTAAATLVASTLKVISAVEQCASWRRAGAVQKSRPRSAAMRYVLRVKLSTVAASRTLWPTEVPSSSSTNSGTSRR